MAIQLVTRFEKFVDEMFATESRKSLLTNDQFDFNGAATIKVYKVSTSTLNEYDRDGTGTGLTGSRYGVVGSLDATTEEFTLTQDKSFTFAIDKLDASETGQQLQAASALARQQREVIIPTIDSHVYGVMCAGAGTKPAAKALTAANIYDEIIAAGTVLDNAEVPETGRVLLVSPETYVLLKKSADIVLETETGADLRLKGVINTLDGASVVKVAASRLPEKFGFALVHPIATVAPVRLADYKIHEDAPGISGSLVEGRVNFGCFILSQKAKAIYYQAIV